MNVRWSYDVALSLAMNHASQEPAFALVMRLTDGYTL